MTYLGEGWDSTAFLVGGRWVERRPRRPGIEPQLVREMVVMPWLAPLLPLPVPMPLPVDRFRAEVRVPGGDELLARIDDLPPTRWCSAAVAR